MTDLRQGVTLTQHAVLDLIERRILTDDALNWEDKECAALAAMRRRSVNLALRRTNMIEAAAYLIDAADEIGRLIGEG